MEQESGFLMDEPSWAQRVKSVRLRLHITQEQLGERLGMDAVSISRWEMREKRPWSPESDRFIQLEAELEMEEPS
jgi:transcriptional regulator with XRE-family HTH domain